MNARIAPLLHAGIALLVLGGCLFSGTLATAPHSSLLAGLRREIMAALRDPGTQWTIALCLLVYFITLVALELRVCSSNPREHNRLWWLITAVLLTSLHYAAGYRWAPQATEATVLIFGIVISRAASMWVRWRSGTSLGGLTASLLILLLAGAVWTVETPIAFEYRGRARWSGPWDNPNVFGLLMAAGLMLAGGICSHSVQLWRSRRRRRAAVSAIAGLIAAVLLGRGLFLSYSRGAWLAAVCGIAYLLLQSFWLQRRRGPMEEIDGSRKPSPRVAKRLSSSIFRAMSWLARNRVPLSVGLLSVGLVCFWQFRWTEWAPARRLFSAGNMNDFSWRNRVNSWEGALSIMAEHPWAGAGWNRPEPLYESYYLRPRLIESAAIQMNDYLTLGATLGVPALVCFCMYFWLCLTQGGGEEKRLGSSRTACRAAAIALLIGFWFDGGLFKLPTAATFWILLELGRFDVYREELPTQHVKAEPRSPFKKAINSAVSEL